MGDSSSAELTMLFTDIEGSTRLLNGLGPEYTGVLATHRTILRAAFAGAAGRELGTEGDSFFVVFGSPVDALVAAAMGQQALEGHPWPRGVRLRVRMGLHTGRPEPFEDDLVGIDVHLAARVSATAHGGQVVLSGATAGRVADELPRGTSLLALGVHRLKDIDEPQALWQLVVPGLPARFPPLRTLGAPGSLPAAPGPLVGREGDLAALATLLSPDGPRLVTLTGPGGAGKTRLALAVAEEAGSAYPDGVHFVDLATAVEPAVAWSTVAEALGRSGDDEDGLLAHLGRQDLLLVLDNLEQLPRAGAEVVGPLLAASGGLRVLATSRRPLRVSGEQGYPVAPLGLPSAESSALTVEAAGQAESVRLFLQQARLADPAFALTDDNVADVVALCQRLDGLPLALELAAARVRLLPPRALLDHLDEALSLPLPGHPARHQTLSAAVAWSYGMVGREEQRALRALSVFGSSGGTLDALAAVLEVPSSLAVVAGLLDAALVRVEDDPAGPRVRLLQTVRSVARELATTEGDLDAFHAGHAQHYLALALQAGDRLMGPDAIASRGALELEMENLRGALDWSLGDAGTGDAGDPGGDERVATGIRLCTALGWFWYLTGHDAESRGWLVRASRAAAASQGPQLAQLLHRLALLLLQQGELADARDVLAKSLLLWRRAHDRTGETIALNSLGVAYRALGERARARDLLRESAEVAQSLENPQRRATALSNLALLEIDDGHPEAALPLLSEAERLDRELGNSWGVAADRVNLAAALLALGRLEDAADLLRELAVSVAEHGDPDLTVGTIELAAVAASMTGDHARAVRLAGCADEERAARRMPLTEPDRAFLDRHVMVSRRILGDEAGAADRQGRRLRPDQALSEVVDLRRP